MSQAQASGTVDLGTQRPRLGPGCCARGHRAQGAQQSAVRGLLAGGEATRPGVAQVWAGVSPATPTRVHGVGWGGDRCRQWKGGRRCPWPSPGAANPKSARRTGPLSGQQAGALPSGAPRECHAVCGRESEVARAGSRARRPVRKLSGDQKELERWQRDRRACMSSPTCPGPPWSQHRGWAWPSLCPQRAPPASLAPLSSAQLPFPPGRPAQGTPCSLQGEPARRWPRRAHLQLNWVGPTDPVSGLLLGWQIR